MWGAIYWLINFPLVCCLFFLTPTLWLKLGIFITLIYSIYANLATDYGAMSAAEAAFGEPQPPPIPLEPPRRRCETGVTGAACCCGRLGGCRRRRRPGGCRGTRQRLTGGTWCAARWPPARPHCWSPYPAGGGGTRRSGRARPEEGARPAPCPARTFHGHRSYRDRGQLPDPRCTPGSIDPYVTQADIRSTICKTGWTGTVRPPESQGRTVQVRRGIPGLRHVPVRADRAGPPRPAGTRRQQRRHQLVAGVPADTEPEGQGGRRPERRRLRGARQPHRCAGRDRGGPVTAEKNLGLGGQAAAGPGAAPAPPTTPRTATTASTCTPASRTGQPPQLPAPGDGTATGPPSGYADCT